MVVQRQDVSEPIYAALPGLAELLKLQDRTMATLQGGCLCGAIHYHSDATPSKMIASDCRHCQKQAGAAIAISVGVRSDSLQVEGLRPSVYEDIRDSGTVFLRSFCPNCGTPLFSESNEHPDLVFIKTASLDDPSVTEQLSPVTRPEDGYRQRVAANRPSSFIGELLGHQARIKVS